MDFKSKIVLIYGPTASGKYDFAIKLAKKIKGEIINSDSMQIYKEIKILSARPTKEDIKHHCFIKKLEMFVEQEYCPTGKISFPLRPLLG